MAMYCELQAMTNYSFLEGASHADELALTAANLGLAGLAVVDRNTLAGVVQAHLAAKRRGLPFIVGCRLDLTDGQSLLAYVPDRQAYARLSQLLTLGKRRAPKGKCFLDAADVLAAAEGLIFALVAPPGPPDDGLARQARFWRDRLREVKAPAFYLAASHGYGGRDAARLDGLGELAAALAVPMLATNDVLMHGAQRRALADVLTCIREKTSIDKAGWRLAANAERHLKPAAEIARLFRRWPQALAHTLEIKQACAFSLDELRYEYPDEVAAPGESAQASLVRLTWEGAATRYPAGVPDKVRGLLARELELIGRLAYAPYFLTVYDIVRFARGRGILCQGRGSAANSAVCYCLGVTAVDPMLTDLLFERFISAARGEPPDIDVDFEHERREEVIQYIYDKYGRDRAGLTAVTTCYRSRGALRDVGKAMGLPPDVTARLAKTVWGASGRAVDEERARTAGIDPADPRVAQTLELAAELIGFPRHLSQHVGGFVVTRGPLSELCPILNAAMADRTTIEWNKDDIDALGILKVDVLALGMLTAIRKSFDLIRTHHGETYTLADVPAEVPAVYDMIARADVMGVFQIESRAQMTMLPRLRPRCFYDLVIEVAIVRPGPIQGGMVHPYLRRRNGEEPVTFPSEALREVLGKTMGVPLFQEQAMRIAIVAAGFSPEDADRLRKSMAAFRRAGAVQAFQDKFINGMLANGYARDFAERCFRQIEGFGEYGFPESHAASFALLVYVSAWIKRFYPAAFACALLNSQPMGFYAPAQLVRDAQAHGVTVRPADVNHSDWDCTLEGPPDRPALRLGFRLVKGLAEADARRLAARRGRGYADMHDVWRRGEVGGGGLERLARADAFGSLGLNRRDALWAVKALGAAPLPLFAGLPADGVREEAADLPRMGLGEHVVMDYASLSLSLKAHPVALLRDRLAAEGVAPADRLAVARDGARLAVAGLALVRQRPGTASGVVFVTLEDETGVVNLVIMPPVFERFRREAMTARLMWAKGVVEKQGAVIHLKATALADWTDLLADLIPDRPPTPEAFSEGRNFH